MPRKDAHKYVVTTKSYVCEACRERIHREQAEARAREAREQKYIDALRKNDDAVLACSRELSSRLEANSYMPTAAFWNTARRMSKLAQEGKLLNSPQSLAEVDRAYSQSMDALIKAMPIMERSLRRRDAESLQEAMLLIAASKIYRDQAIEKIGHRL